MPIRARIAQGRGLVTLLTRSRAAHAGPRRSEHPFAVGLRAGQVIPHQGGHWPDAHPNTMEAYVRAATRSQILDVDLWLTSDGVLVCSHDDEFEPGKRISETTWSTLGSTTSIPRFVDVTAAFPQHRLNVEIKSANSVGPLRDVIELNDLAHRTCLSAFSPIVARALAGGVPDAAHARPTARRVGRIWGSGDVVQTMTFVPDAAAALGGLKPFLLRLFFSAGSPELVQRQVPIAARKRLPLFAWTVNEPEPLRALLDSGVDAVLSDRPELFDEPTSD